MIPRAGVRLPDTLQSQDGQAPATIAAVPDRVDANRGARIRAPHPFLPFAAEDVEQSIPRRFDQQVRAYGDRVAMQSDQGSVSVQQRRAALLVVVSIYLTVRDSSEWWRILTR